MISFEEYLPGDLDRIHARDVDAFEFPGLDEQIEQGHTFTVHVDGEPVALLGVLPSWPGVGTCWALISDQARGQHAVRLTKGARGIVQSMMFSYGMHRMQCYVQPIEEYQRWIRLLGFRYESTARMALPDRGDLETWVILREDA